jgi:filamentous hemagglutinin family protein
MNHHASMNRIYRLVWREATRAWVAVAETARHAGRRSGPRLMATALSVSSVMAHAGPAGGQVTAGTAVISQSGNTTTVAQASPTLSLTWQSFNIAHQETVDFLQPSVTAIAVNRILGNDGTQILGHLNANGQVYLINPNGVLFGPGAQVDVGGLVASTLNLNESTLGDSSRTFSGPGAGSVVNEGMISASAGSTVALLGNLVSNTGVISAQLGTVALGAGSAATLTFRGTRLVSMQVDQSVLNSQAANGGLLRADGGQVLMTAGAQQALLASVVNNSGVIEARTLENHGGTITLLGGMSAGTVLVGGTLDASAASGGNGGSIDTSAAHVEIAASAKVTTAAALGLAGSWLIDPVDFTIAPTGGDETGAQLSTALTSGNVTIQSSGGSTGTAGNINVDDNVTWAAHTLTLSAQSDININSVMNASGTASLALLYGQKAVSAGNTSTYIVNAPVNLPAGPNFSTKLGANGAVTDFIVITTLGQAADATTAPGVATLQGMAATANLGGNFVLGASIDATVTSGWNGGAGFTPIGTTVVDPGNGSITSVTPFTGAFDGLGHTVSNLFIYEPYTEGVALFGVTSAAAAIRNVGVLAGSVTGSQSAGILVGKNSGSVYGSYATGTVTALEYNNGLPSAGGLVGTNYGAGVIDNSHASTNVTGTADVGGLVGDNQGAIRNSYATGSVYGLFYVGGLLGNNEALATIDTSYSTGAVTSSAGGEQVGGLVGSNAGALSNSFYDVDQVQINGSHQMTLGGIYDAQYLDWINHNETLNIANYSSSLPAGTGGYYNVSSVQGIEDLLGFSENNAADSFRLTANISLPAGLFIPYFMGSFDGAGYVISNLSVSLQNDNIGLFGVLPSSASLISNLSVSHGSVSGNNYVGGLVGNNRSGASISNSSFSGSVTGDEYVGGLVGINDGTLTGNHATGSVSGEYEVGGLVGGNYGAAIINSYAAVTVSGVDYVGGLVGFNYGSIADSFASGTVTSSSYTAGGLVGGNGGSISNSYASGAVSGDNAGGLVGSNYSGSVSNSYASGTVTGGGPTGGLVGSNFGTVTNSFYNSSANPTLAGMGNAADAAGTVLGMSLAQLQTQANFTSATSANGNVNPGWDFTSSWILYEGHTNPLLRPFMTALVVGGGVTTQTYDGAAFAPDVGSLNYSIVPDPTLLSGTVTVTGSAQGAVHAGSYTYTAGGLYSSQLGYLVTYADTALTITPAPLTVAGTVTVASKVYNGTTVATLTGGTLAGVVAGDSIALTQAGTYASKNVGSGIPVASDDVLSGANVGDYTLIQPVGLTGIITPAPLSVNGTQVGNKAADGNRTAILTGGTLSGVLSGDSVTLSQAGTFASSGAGTGIAVTADDTLGGASASDYSLIQPAGLSASITSANSAPAAPSGALLAAENVITRLLPSLLDPQFGDASTADFSAFDQEQTVAQNVSVRRRGAATLRVENGGVRLPASPPVGPAGGE